MAFLRGQFLLLKGISAFICCSFLLSCSGSKSEILFEMVLPEEDSREQVVVPASFTEARARRLGGQVDSIFRYLHKKKGFNGTVLVTKYDQVIYRGAFGYADFSQKDTLTIQTAFQLASVSKPFTAMAIMMLKEEGELDYEDSVQQYVPSFPYAGMTVRALLNHRSGIPNYTNFSEKLWPNRKVPLTNEDVLHLMTEHQPKIHFLPNARFEYSNTGYAVLAAIVEKVSGMPFATFLQERIFEPLQMTHTFTFSPEALQQKEKVAGGHLVGKRKRAPDYLDAVLGDKGVYSTVEDLYKWDQALYTQKLVKRETLKEGFNGFGSINKKNEDYGFGWRLRQVESGDTVVYHRGLWHGYNTYLLRNPKDHSAIIVLSNLTNGSLNYMKDLRNFLYPGQPMVIAQQTNKKRRRATVQL